MRHLGHDLLQAEIVLIQFKPEIKHVLDISESNTKRAHNIDDIAHALPKFHAFDPIDDLTNGFQDLEIR